MENLKNKEKIVSILEEIINVNSKIVGTIFKKEIFEEVLFQTNQYYFTNGSLFKSETFSLDTNQKILKEYSNGKLLSDKELDKYGCISYKTIQEYDINGNIILRQTDFTGSSTYKHEYINSYDNQSKLIKIKCSTNSKFEYTEDICHDSNNNISLIWRRDSNNNEIYKRNNYYNYFNQPFKGIGVDYENGNRIRFEHLYEYNNNGDVSVYTSSKNDKKKITKYEYKYDYQSNWIEKKQFQENCLIKIFKRSINYR